MKFKLYTFLLIAGLVCPAFCIAQVKIAVSGFVKDAETGEAVIGAVVYNSNKSVGVSTNEFGYYSLTLSKGSDVLTCACIGYIDMQQVVESSGAAVKLDFLMNEDKMQLEAAQVFSRTKKDVLKMPQMGAQTVDAVVARKLPALMGETDIIKVIQMLPGVQTPSEGSTGFSVRGGGVDQNLILMDGAPIYNAGHFLGFFSMFNGDAVKSAQLYKGDFPAKYGGKTASVLDINTVDGNSHDFGGSASIGLLTAKIFLEGPIVKDKASFMFSARRSYLDVFFPLFKNYFSQDTKLAFYDVNAKVNWQINDNNRIYLSAFSSDDVFGAALSELGIGLMTFDYKNNTQSFRWNHIFSPKLFSNLTVYNSHYLSGIDADMDEAPFTWNSTIFETGVKESMTWYINDKNTMEFGVNIANFNLNPSETHPKSDSFVNEVISPRTYAFNPSAYIQNETKLDKLTLRYGLRFSSFTTTGETDQFYYDRETYKRIDSIHFDRGARIKTYCGFEPRASLSYSLSDNISLKAAYARSMQYVQQAVVSISGSVLDAWYTASPNVKPQISDQYSIGYNQNFLDDGLELSIEGFYKNNENTIDLRDNPGLVIDNKDREGLLRFGNSYAYGVESMLRFEFAKLNGWVAYTWSKSMYQIDEINNGEPYRSPLNHKHAINAVATYDFSKKVSSSVSWVYYSGTPTTYPVSRFDFYGTQIPIYSSRNNDSMPDYHRLDLSLTLKSDKRIHDEKWSGEWNFSLYNAYGRHNAWSISNSFNRATKVAESTKIYIFTAIPSVSYTLYF